MKALSIEEIAMAVKGSIVGEITDVITNVSTDSRADLSGCLFIPLKGQRVDGHDFIDVAYANGAVAVLSEKDIKTKKCYVKVDSTKEALCNLAEYYMSTLSTKVIAITGSVGKTTTKDMVASVLSEKYKTIKTEGNFNNDIGVPLTIFRIEPWHEYAVIEMGMNHFGEIEKLSKMAKPDVCLITNIGLSHIENLGSREGILKAKCEIFSFMKTNGAVFLNGDDDMLSKIVGKFGKTVSYGSLAVNDVFASDVKENQILNIGFKIHSKLGEANVTLDVPGRHMVYACLAATAIGEYCDLSTKEILNGFKKFSATKMRMSIINCDNEITILNDIYNASPDSVRNAMNILKKANGRKVCILGDMFELGDFAPQLHKDVLDYGISLEFDKMIVIGSNYNKAAKKIKFKEIQNIISFETMDEFFKEMGKLIRKGDQILVKASRGMKFEEVTDKLIKLKLLELKK